MAHYYAFALPDVDLAAIVGGAGQVATGTCKLFVRLKDMQGKPLVGQRIFFHESATAPLEGPSVKIETDANGYAEVSLLVGRQVTVVFVGTTFAREIEVPDQAMADILELADLSDFDAFSVVRPDPIPAIRRS
jgi:hypothetical protein